MVKVKEDLTGRVFGRLLVIEQAEDYINPQGTHYAQWLCECLCEEHNKVVVLGSSLKRGNTRSCGCIHKESISATGKTNHKPNVYDLSGEFGIGWTNNTNNEFYFDLDDYDKIKDYCWYEYIADDGYHILLAHNPENNKVIKFFHLIGYKSCDHIDRNPLNNKKSNLRSATMCQNMQNRSKFQNNTSGVTGVLWDKSAQKWTARIKRNKQAFNLGYFINKEDAIRARLNAEVKYFGEFAPQQHLYEQYGIKRVEE